MIRIQDACGMFDDCTPELRLRIERLAVHTRASCSCMGCGNQRKVEGLKLHELRSVLDMQAQLLDVA